MNLIIIRQLTILSLLLGAFLGIITLIPFIGTISFIILMFFSAMLIILLMVKLELLQMSDVKGSIVIGAIIGFVSFLGFSVIYLPLVAVLGRVFKLYMHYGVSLFLGAGSFGVILMLVIFMAILCAITNAFSGFATYYFLEFIKQMKQNQISNQGYNQDYDEQYNQFQQQVQEQNNKFKKD